MLESRSPGWCSIRARLVGNPRGREVNHSTEFLTEPALKVNIYLVDEKRVVSEKSVLISLLSQHFLSQGRLLSGEGNGNTVQYSCLESPMNRGAWWAAVHRVAQSRTWLKQLSSSSSRLLSFSLSSPDCMGPATYILGVAVLVLWLVCHLVTHRGSFHRAAKLDLLCYASILLIISIHQL